MTDAPRRRRFSPGKTAVRAAALLFMLAATAFSLDAPRAPALYAGDDGMIAGGWQAVSGDDEAYELFSLPSEGGFVRLGKFSGRLAGVAVHNGEVLALTVDGALDAHGDEPRSLANPDPRMRMAALAWWDGAPLALALTEDGLFTARPNAAGDWERSAAPAAKTRDATDAALVPLGDKLHLLWTHMAADLSGGAIRHHVLADGIWTELPPLTLGDVAAFSAHSPDGGALSLAAILPDIADRSRIRLAVKTWRDGGWREDRLPPALAERLAEAYGYASAGGKKKGAAYWLATGPYGTLLLEQTEKTLSTETLAAPGDGIAGSEQWLRLATLAGIVLLAVVYCRRSRTLARKFPAHPPDLSSRGAALAVDWLLVSFCMGAFHAANGDAHILGELLLRGDILDIFWTNLVALSLFMAVMEGLFGRTPGKYLAGLRVRNVRGGKPGFSQALFRNALRLIDMFPVSIGFPGVIGIVATFLNPGRQRVGDLLASTVVRRHLPLTERTFLLASASPRRLELLKALGANIRAEATDIDESAVQGENPRDTVMRLSQAKAHAAKPDRDIVVAADTVVVLDGEVLGKPKDADDAKNMLSRLSGRSHSVFTGVTVWDAATGQAMSDVEETEVEFRTLSEHEIDSYVATGDPMDKAGAYGVQTGFLVKQVRGSLSNVAGLPMEKLQGLFSMLDA